MNIFVTKANLERQVQSLTQQLADANKLKADIETRIKDLEAKATGVSKEDYQKVVDENTQLKGSITTLETSLNAEKENTKEFETKVSAKVLEELAKAGSPMVKVESDQVKNPDIYTSKDGIRITTLQRGGRGFAV